MCQHFSKMSPRKQAVRSVTIQASAHDLRLRPIGPLQSEASGHSWQLKNHAKSIGLRTLQSEANHHSWKRHQHALGEINVQDTSPDVMYLEGKPFSKHRPNEGFNRNLSTLWRRGLLNPSWTRSKHKSGAKGKATLMLAPKLQRCICLHTLGSQDTTNRSNRSPWIPPMWRNHNGKPN